MWLGETRCVSTPFGGPHFFFSLLLYVIACSTISSLHCPRFFPGRETATFAHPVTHVHYCIPSCPRRRYRHRLSFFQRSNTFKRSLESPTMHFVHGVIHCAAPALASMHAGSRCMPPAMLAAGADVGTARRRQCIMRCYASTDDPWQDGTRYSPASNEQSAAPLPPQQPVKAAPAAEAPSLAASSRERVETNLLEDALALNGAISAATAEEASETEVMLCAHAVLSGLVFLLISRTSSPLLAFPAGDVSMENFLNLFVVMVGRQLRRLYVHVGLRHLACHVATGTYSL